MTYMESPQEPWEIERLLRSYPCPTCQAKPGDICTWTLGAKAGEQMRVAHYLRYLAWKTENELDSSP